MSLVPLTQQLLSLPPVQQLVHEWKNNPVLHEATWFSGVSAALLPTIAPFFTNRLLSNYRGGEVAALSAAAYNLGLTYARYYDPATADARGIVARETGSLWAGGATRLLRERIGSLPLSLYNQACDAARQARDAFPDVAQFQSVVWAPDNLAADASFDDVIRRHIETFSELYSDPRRQIDFLANEPGRRYLFQSLVYLQQLHTISTVAQSNALTVATPQEVTIESLLDADERESLAFTRTAVLEMYVANNAVAPLEGLPDVMSLAAMSPADLVMAALQVPNAAGPSDDLLTGLCWMTETQLHRQALQQFGVNADVSISYASSHMARDTLSRLHARSKAWDRDNDSMLQCERAVAALERNRGMQFTTTPMSLFLSARQYANQSTAENFQKEFPVPYYLASLLSQPDALSGIVVLKAPWSMMPVDYQDWLLKWEYYTRVIVNLPADLKSKVEIALWDLYIELMSAWEYQVVALLLLARLTNRAYQMVESAVLHPLETLINVWSVLNSYKVFARLRQLVVATEATTNAMRSIRISLLNNIVDASMRSRVGAAFEDQQKTGRLMNRLLLRCSRWQWACMLLQPMAVTHRLSYQQILSRARDAFRSRWERDAIVPLPISRRLRFRQAAQQQLAQVDVDVDSYFEQLVFGGRKSKDDSTFLVLLVLLLQSTDTGV